MDYEYGSSYHHSDDAQMMDLEPAYYQGSPSSDLGLIPLDESKRVKPVRFLSKRVPTIRDLEKRRFPCQAAGCSKVCTSRDRLKEHNAVTHVREFACRVCNKAFVTYDHLTKHYKRRHTGFVVPCRRTRGSESFDCDQCNRHFTSALDLERHALNGHKMINCPDCSYEAFKYSDVRSHRLSAHPGGRHKCRACNEAFTLKFFLAEHNEKWHNST